VFRKGVLLILALIFCALVVVGIDVARHVVAIRSLERKGVTLYDWHYRLSGGIVHGRFTDAPAGSWRGRLHRMIGSPRSCAAYSIALDRSLVRDLAVLGVSELRLSDCAGLTPAVMADVARLTSLRMLVLYASESDLTNESVDALWAGLPNLEVFCLQRKGIGDDAFRSVGAARKLNTVIVLGAGISAKTIEYLRAVPRLETIELAWVNVTEECVPALAAMPALRKVSVRNVRGGWMIREELRTLRPDVEVVYFP